MWILACWCMRWGKMQVPPGLRASVIFSTACLLQKETEKERDTVVRPRIYIHLDYDGPAWNSTHSTYCNRTPACTVFCNVRLTNQYFFPLNFNSSLASDSKQQNLHTKMCPLFKICLYTSWQILNDYSNNNYNNI